MAIREPERIWWKPFSKDERMWVTVAVVWMLVSFLFMPIYHLYGAQNPPSETYKVEPEAFDKLVTKMIDKYKVGEENGFPIVHPDPNEPVFIRAQMWQWYPIIEFEKGKTYRVHLSSMDIQHGFSVQPINLNFMALPGYDYVLKLTPTTSGEFHIVCNEYCGVGHHTMVGKIYVKDAAKTAAN
ncbi:MAG: cytochrome C oxidase subunit II [Deltaproteobacteria bacterium]|nr:cytochrome C oxidase subunit II [Deltaproteobacteria bacterium]